MYRVFLLTFYLYSSSFTWRNYCNKKSEFNTYSPLIHITPILWYFHHYTFRTFICHLFLGTHFWEHNYCISDISMIVPEVLILFNVVVIFEYPIGNVGIMIGLIFLTFWSFVFILLYFPTSFLLWTFFPQFYRVLLIVFSQSRYIPVI